MLTLKEYVDHHASRFVYLGSRRAVSNLHALKNVAQDLAAIQTRRAMGWEWAGGRWIRPGSSPEVKAA